MEEQIAGSQQTIEALLELSKRDHVPLRNSFVQRSPSRIKGRAVTPKPGILAEFVAARHDRALEQYLLLHAAASAAPFDVARESQVWARALGLGTASSSRTAISKNWRWLEERRLITRGRKARKSVVTILREDGAGKPYSHPASDKPPRWFKLPYAYWLGEYHRQLDLPGKSFLLIALSLEDGFVLPSDQVQRWYGISAQTLTRGQRSLRRADVLDVRRNRKTAPLAPEGFAYEYSYTLKPPFDSAARRGKAKS